MQKPTIKDIERAIKLLNTSEISSKEDSDNGSFEENINIKLDIELAKKRLTQKEYKIIELAEYGMSNKEICKELKISPDLIKSALDKLYGIIK